MRDQILGSFTGSIRPVKVTPTYHVALVLVSVVMVLLPVVYLALVIATGWATVHHGLNNLTLFDTIRSAKVAFLAYATPLFVGAVAVAFLIKPLFAPRVPTGPRISLTERSEPLLFAFVRRLCQEVGAPMPSRIDVDSQVNASASFRRGFASMVGNDLVLTIGLPLVRGLTLQQLAGVLAHEFGHFAQGAGMRLSYVVRSINAWFARVVYQRDAWDEQLEGAAHASAEAHLGLWLAVQLARAMVWLTRRILWALMMVGHALSCFLLRQMEYDADRYEARLVGADTFDATARELTLLGVGHQKALHDLSATWQDGRLVDDLPRLVVANRGQLDAATRTQIEDHRTSSKTGTFDTHPADADRVASARQETDPPVFRTALPATALFREADRLAIVVSKGFYEDTLGQKIDESQLIDADAVLDRADREAADRLAFDRVVGSPLDLERGLPWPADTPPTHDVGALAQRLDAARSAVLEGRSTFSRRLAEWEEVFSQSIQVDYAEHAIHADKPIEAKEFGLEKADLETVASKRRLFERRAELLDRSLGQHESLLAERFAVALAALDLPETGELDPRITAAREERDRLVPIVRAMAELRDDFSTLRRNLGRYVFVANNLTEDMDAPSEALIALTVALRRELGTLADAWDQPYPFEHPNADLTVGGWVVGAPPDALEGQALFELTQTCLQRSYEAYARMMARLAGCVELGEARLGFQPTEAPADPPMPT
ncbi:MAG: M48 family metalloprotease [Acidobacteriota bacterium]